MGPDKGHSQSQAPPKALLGELALDPEYHLLGVSHQWFEEHLPDHSWPDQGSAIRHTGDVLPWEWSGLPDYLTTGDFAVVEEVAAGATSLQAPSGREFVRACGEWSMWANAAGSSNEHNQLRIKRLLTHPPLDTQTTDDEVVYPVVFVPDPSRTEGSPTVPIGACSVEGYVGSAWGAFTNDWARLVDEGIEQRFYVSLLRLFPRRYEAFVHAEIWLPMPKGYRRRQERRS